MDIQLLRTFLSVCELRHFGRAAEQLCVTQSAVSARIRLLEETLGVLLFDRRRLAIAPTAAGQRLLPHARTIVDTWQRARQETALEPALSQAFGVGATPDVWPTLMARGFAQRATASCETAWRMESDSAELLLRRLRDGLLDLLFLFQLPGEGGGEVLVRELCHSDLWLCAAVADVDAGGAPDGAGYLQVERCGAVARRQSALRGDSPAPRLRCNSATLALGWLREAGGSAWLDAAIAAPALAAGELRRVPGAPRLRRPVYALCRQALADEATLAALLDGLATAPAVADENAAPPPAEG